MTIIYGGTHQGKKIEEGIKEPNSIKSIWLDKSSNALKVYDESKKEWVSITGEGGGGSADKITFIDESGNIIANNVSDAIKELFQSVSSGKEVIATIITDKGIIASSNDSFQTLANKVSQINTVENMYAQNPIVIVDSLSFQNDVYNKNTVENSGFSISINDASILEQYFPLPDYSTTSYNSYIIFTSKYDGTTRLVIFNGTMEYRYGSYYLRSTGSGYYNYFWGNGVWLYQSYSGGTYYHSYDVEQFIISLHDVIDYNTKDVVFTANSPIQ